MLSFKLHLKDRRGAAFIFGVLSFLACLLGNDGWSYITFVDIKQRDSCRLVSHITDKPWRFQMAGTERDQMYMHV
jgi:hypothetical protein